MTKIRKARFKTYRTGIRFNARREKIRLTLNKINLRIWNSLEYRKILKRSKYPKAMDTPWRLNYKSKQEIKAFYGGISESTFKKLNKKNTGQLLISKFETRLDVIIFKLNWAMSIYHAKQIINHGHIMVNGTQMKIASYILSPGDTIQIHSNTESKKIIKSYLRQKLSRIKFVSHLIYAKGVPYFVGGKKSLKGKIEHWLYLPMCLEVDYFTMSATLIWNNENERIFMYHPLKPYNSWMV